MASPVSTSERGLRLARRVAFGLFCGALLAGQADAGQLQVMPTRLGVTAETPSTTLYATNADTVDASYQLTVYDWSQKADGNDQLDPTRDVLANPAIFTAKPGEQQVIRFGLRNTAASATERSYRVVLQELPRPTAAQTTGIRTLLRISVPLFVPATNPAVAMRWALRPSAGGAQLIGRNAGNVHVQIIGVEIGEGKDQVGMKGSIYVLPGMSHTIDIKAAKPLPAGATYHVRLLTDQGPMTADLRADPAATPSN